jgi:hypothetical protein
MLAPAVLTVGYYCSLAEFERRRCEQSGVA